MATIPTRLAGIGDSSARDACRRSSWPTTECLFMPFMTVEAEGETYSIAKIDQQFLRGSSDMAARGALVNLNFRKSAHFPRACLDGRHFQRRSNDHRSRTQPCPESVDLVLQGFYLYLPSLTSLIASAFLGRDNVIEVALGLIIGAGFSNVVTSLVSDIILPPLSLLSSTSRNLESHFIVLRQGDTLDAIYNTVEQAAADGSQK